MSAPRSPLTTLIISAFAPLLVGCQIGASDQHWTAVDSAGVRVVQNEAPGDEWSPRQWSLAGQPDVSIAQDESDPTAVWTYVRSVFWRPDSSIGLGVADPPYLRVFTPDGVPALTLGERGDGPGEHQGAVWAGALGNSLLIRGPRGLAIYDENGEFESTIAFPGGEQPDVLATTESGWLIRVSKPYDDNHGAGPPQVVADMSVIRAGLDGRVVDTLLSFQQVPTWRLQNALWGSLRHVASDGPAVYLMDSEEYEIRAYEDGRLTEIIRAPIPTLSEFGQRHFDAMASEWGPLAERFLSSDREAGRLIVPPAVAILADARRGELWVRRTDDGPGSMRTWDVFESGVWTSTVEVPSEFSIHEVRDRKVLGIWTDDLGVTGVRVYSVAEGQ